MFRLLLPAANRLQDSSVQEGGLDPTAAPKGKLLQTDPVQLCELLGRLSELQVRPHQQWLEEVLDTLQPRLQDLSSAQLSSTFQVLGSWGFMPSESWMQDLHAAVRTQLGSMSMRHIADLTWGLAQLQNPKQPLLGELLEAALDMMQSGRCSTDSSTGSQQQDGCQVAQQPQQQQQESAQACSPASLADLVWSVAKLQHNPGSLWLETFLHTTMAPGPCSSKPLLHSFTPHQLAQVIWAFARLPHQPGQPWMELFLDAVREGLHDFDSKSVSLTAWGLATLKASPTARWLFAFERQCERTLSTLAASELACTLWALSELKEKRADKLRLGRLVRRQEVFWGFDYEALANPRLLRVVRQLTLGPQGSRG
jgi:hypothetical protein